MKKLSFLLVLLLNLPALAHAGTNDANGDGASDVQAVIDSLNGIAGLWYDPSLDGEGFNVITTPAGIVVFFYGYTSEGQRLWLVSEASAGEFSFGQQLELQMYEGTGGTFEEPAPSAVALSKWGTLNIEITSCDSGLFDLDGIDGVKTTQQVKLAGIMDASCSQGVLPPPSGLAGLWYDPALDGEGYNIIVTGNSTVFFFYGYDWNGQRLWLISEPLAGAPKIGVNAKLKMFSASGGTFDAPAPSSEALREWGTLDITFTHCDQAKTVLHGPLGLPKNSNLVQLGKIGQSTCPQSSNGHNVMLRVVLVTVEWSPFASTGGWTQAVSIKETDTLKYYEAAIWEETSSVHLYAFPNNYNPSYEQLPGVTDEQKSAYREQFLISKVTGLPAAGAARQAALREAFKDFASILVSRHPDSNHHLMYSGHGGPGGKLFQGELTYQDAAGFLQHWSQHLGRKLGVVDMGGPCNKGGFSDLENFCRYAEYYIASDLENGGYIFDEWTSEKSNEVEPELQYHALFAGQPDFKTVLTRRIDLKRQAYLYSQNFMIANKVMQANYLYSCSEFNQWGPQFKSFLSGKPKNYFDTQDLYQYMQTNGAPASLKQGFEKVIEYRADNRDFFPWTQSRNGMTMPSN